MAKDAVYVEKKCIDCGKSFNVRFETVKRKESKGDNEYRCTKCWNILKGKRHHEWYNNLSADEKAKLSMAPKQYWDSLSTEEKNSKMSKLGDKYKNWVDSLNGDEKSKRYKLRSERYHNKSAEEKDAINTKRSDSHKKEWNNRSDADKDKQIHQLRMANQQWRNNASDEELSKIYKSISDTSIKNWAALSINEKMSQIHKSVSNKMLKSDFCKRFEKSFDDSSLSNDYVYKAEFPISNNDIGHIWDYAIIDVSGNIVAVVDLDGAYYHADNCDYDGIHSREEYDENRSQSVPAGIQIYIITEMNFKQSFEYMVTHLMHDYDEYVNTIFNEMRMQPFPEPHFSDKELLDSWKRIYKLKCNDGLHITTLNTRIGDRLIQHFHSSIWSDHRKGEISPYDAWYNDNLLRKCIENRIIYQTNVNPNKILQGFNVSKIAPKVSVFSAGRAKIIIDKYLSEYNEIFDPFSGYSGRMLGAISLGKTYIGQDISIIHVNESNNLLKFLHSKGINFHAEITHKDILHSSGKYQCLFTCSPYADKEQWQDVPVSLRSCDDWIDECLQRFDCCKYVFVVDNTMKYSRYVVDEISNKSHLSNAKELLIVMKKEDIDAKVY